MPKVADRALIGAATDLYAALEALYSETCEYMEINNLGKPEGKHNLRWAARVLAQARGEA